MVSKLRRRYSVFGLLVESEVDLLGTPRVSGREGEPDIHVSYGCVPENLPLSDYVTDYFEAGVDSFLLKIDEVGRFLIREGREIVVDPEGGASRNDVRMFLMGSAFGAALQQRGFLTLHACLLRDGAGCIAVAGESGAGKSTLSAWLDRSGLEIVADDVCAASVMEDRVLVFPGFRRIKLWEDALESLGWSAENLFPVENDDGRAKYEMPLDPLVCSDPLPLRSIYVLEPPESGSDQIRALNSAESLSALIEHTYRFEYLNERAPAREHFSQCVDTLKRVRLYRFPADRDQSAEERAVQLMDHLAKVKGQGDTAMAIA